jgi:hypothetical protein
MFFEWTGIDNGNEPASATRADVLHQTLKWLLGRDKPVVAVTAPNGGDTLAASSYNVTWNETLDGAATAQRTIEFSPDAGVTWTTLTTNAGPSPYAWNLSSVANTSSGRIRVRVTDNGSPAFSGYDLSDANFVVHRAGGDLAGPAVVAGSIRSTPNPIVNTGAATLNATVTDARSGNSNVAQAEWSVGPVPMGPGVGHPMSGSFSSSTEAVVATIPIGAFNPGDLTLWVRGRDAQGNWGAARGFAVRVNGTASNAVELTMPRQIELRTGAPNPVQQSTNIVFALPVASSVRLGIYDITGRRVKTLVEGALEPGFHSVRWDRSSDDGRLVAPGVYWSRMEVAGRTLQRRLVTLD